MKAYFYPKSTYTSVVAFSDMFNNMSIRVYDKDGRITGAKPVLLKVGSKEKIASILLNSDVNDVDPQKDNYLPQISILSNGISFDAERMRGKYEKRLLNIEYFDSTQLDSQGRPKRREMQIDSQPVPYNLSFEVTIWTKYQIDMWQILENILPWFAPESHISIKERNFGIERKRKVTLNGTSLNNTVELGENDRRIIQTTLSFTMETDMYKPMAIEKEILCSIISIAEVPCKRSPFSGEKVIAVEKDNGNGIEVISFSDPDIKIGIDSLDAGESYDLMTRYWTFANNNMKPPFYSSCVNNNCNTEKIGDRPQWDINDDGIADLEQPSPCLIKQKNPLIFVDSQTQNITIYYQTTTTIPQSNSQPPLIIITSYQEIRNPTGNLISGPLVIPNEDYPTPPINLTHLE